MILWEFHFSEIVVNLNSGRLTLINDLRLFYTTTIYNKVINLLFQILTLIYIFFNQKLNNYFVVGLFVILINIRDITKTCYLTNSDYQFFSFKRQLRKPKNVSGRFIKWYMLKFNVQSCYGEEKKCRNIKGVSQ